MKKFQNIQSKLGQDVLSERPKTGASVRPKTAASHVAFGRSTTQDFNNEEEESKPVDQNCDQENDGAVSNSQQIDFIDEQSTTPTIDKHKNFGKVPSYIEKFKEEMKMTAEQKEL